MRTDTNTPSLSVNKELSSKGSRIKVVVRKRPLSNKEIQNGEIDLIEIHPGGERLTIAEPKTRVDLTKFVHNHDFTFDAVFDCDASNVDIYSECCRPLIFKVFQGSKATCFAYGQTGSGKSWTMLGQGSAQLGLYVQAAKDIFSVQQQEEEYSHLSVKVSYFEIYGDKLFDLLQRRKELKCREDRKQRVNIIGLTIKHCSTEDDLLATMYEGNQIRATGVTGANSRSSRSHAVLSIELKASGSEKTHGRFSFIDLAGSERGADTMQNNKQTRREGAEINKSLLALKECIRALDMRHAHKPFRQSMLTRVLKESFIGDAYTLMIANVSPSSGCSEDTLNALRYADRVKDLSRGSVSSKKHNPYMPHKNLASSKRGKYDWKKSVKGKISSSQESTSRPSSAESLRRGRKELGQRSLPPTKREISKHSRSPRARVSPSEETTPRRRSIRNKNNAPKSGNKYRTSRKGKSGYSEPNSSPENQSKQFEILSAPVTMAPQFVDTLKPPQMKKLKKLSNSSEHMSKSPSVGIFQEEDKLVMAHRKHIDEYMVLIKQDMQILKKFDHSMSVNAEEYVSELKELLLKKMKSTDQLWNTVINFQTQQDNGSKKK